MARCSAKRIIRVPALVPVVVALLAGTWVGCAGATGPSEPRGKWIPLVGGDGLEGWRQPTGDWLNVGDVRVDAAQPGRLQISEKPGCGVLLNGRSGRTRNLLSQAAFGDVEAHIEFMVPKGSNSGVYFMGRYEIQVLDSFGNKKVGHGDCGGIYQRWDPKRGKGREGYEGHAPRINASKAPGQWQTFDVVFRAPRFDAKGKRIAKACFVKVVHNGVLVHENVELTGPTRAAGFGDEKPTGPLMLQGDHGPVAYRNIRIRPLRPPPASETKKPTAKGESG